MVKVFAVMACMLFLQGCIHKIVTVPVKIAYKTTKGVVKGTAAVVGAVIPDGDDEDSEQNARQLAAFSAIRQAIPARRYSLANSAGICLGADYAFDLRRPGIALYGGTPRGEAAGHIRQVAFPEARVLQVREVRQGETVGYGATWTAGRNSRIAVANMGYADGYLRCHAGSGARATWQTHMLPLVGRVSMDLIAFAVSDVRASDEGRWLALDYDLPSTSARCGLSQYELLTGLGARFERDWL